MARTSKSELESQARARGLTLTGDETAGELQSKLDQGDLDKAADTAIDGHHKDSIIEDVPDEEKSAATSVQQREIRPDEQDLPPGTSAFQTPPAGSAPPPEE